MNEKMTGQALMLSADDADIMNTVLSLDPIMQVTAFALKLRKEHDPRCSYPIEKKSSLFEAFDGDELVLNGHQINLSTIEEYVDDHLLPILDDRELASAVYLAVSRCSAEFAWAQAAPTNARELLELVERQASDRDDQDTSSVR